MISLSYSVDSVFSSFSNHYSKETCQYHRKDHFYDPAVNYAKVQCRDGIRVLFKAGTEYEFCSKQGRNTSSVQSRDGIRVLFKAGTEYEFCFLGVDLLPWYSVRRMTQWKEDSIVTRILKFFYVRVGCLH